MAANIFFQEEGQLKWKCCCCGTRTAVGMGTIADVSHVMVGGITLGTVCKTCLPGIALRIKGLFNHQLQEVA
jgi:hypothetical protein